jgi:hypothetical protein
VGPRDRTRPAVAALLAAVFGATLSGGASAGKAANGVSWFVNGKPAPVVIRATVGRETGTGVNAYLTITAKRKGPADEPLNGYACLYKRSATGGLRGGPPAFNDCSKVPGVDVCNMKPTISAEVTGESYGCTVPGSPTKKGTYRFRLWTNWTDFEKDPSGHTMGYDIHTFTVLVTGAPRQ